MPIVCFAVLCAAAASVGACRPNRPDQPLPPPVVTTPTTAPSYDIPAVIDAAYVARVMQALDHIYGNAIRHLAQTRSIDETFLRHLVAIYTDRFFRLAQDAWVQDAARGLPRLASNPGDPMTTVQEVRQANPDCVVIRVIRDFGPTVNGSQDETPQRYVGLVPLPAGRDPERLNPTPWAMAYDGFTTTGSVPEDPCRQN